MRRGIEHRTRLSQNRHGELRLIRGIRGFNRILIVGKKYSILFNKSINILLD